MQGYIYVEAFKESHVKEAIAGLRCIYPSKGAKLVPMREAVDAITVNRKAKAGIGARRMHAACSSTRALCPWHLLLLLRNARQLQR